LALDLALVVDNLVDELDDGVGHLRGAVGDRAAVLVTVGVVRRSNSVVGFLSDQGPML
jgi:hypothetical protein